MFVYDWGLPAIDKRMLYLCLVLNGGGSRGGLACVRSGENAVGLADLSEVTSHFVQSRATSHWVRDVCIWRT